MHLQFAIQSFLLRRMSQLKIGLVCVLSTAIMACGQTGALYLPTKPTPEPVLTSPENLPSATTEIDKNTSSVTEVKP